MQGEPDHLLNARAQLDEASWALHKVRDIQRRRPGITVEEMVLEMDAEVRMWGAVLLSMKGKRR